VTLESAVLGELRRMYEGNAWHGPSVMEALRDVPAAQAAARPVRGAHTIHELTHHIAAWMGEVSSRLRGNPAGNPADGDFPAPGATVDEATWLATLQLLDRRHAEVMATVAAFDPERLHDPVDRTTEASEADPRTFYSLIHGLVQHNAYHAGQIMLLRRAIERSE
jgi:uncharacterized damage-inducible protein DinB